MISPAKRRARAMAAEVLPTPVGPQITTMRGGGGGKGSMGATIPKESRPGQ